jgi:VanZ family protein
MKDLFRYQKLTLGWALFILVICNLNMGSLTRSPRFFPGFDKLVHCGLFFVFVVLYSQALIRKGCNITFAHAVKVFIAGVAYGALIEVLQIYIFTWRTGDLADLFADSVGAGMAAFSVLVTADAIKKSART